MGKIDTAARIVISEGIDQMPTDMNAGALHSFGGNDDAFIPYVRHIRIKNMNDKTN